LPWFLSDAIGDRWSQVFGNGLELIDDGNGRFAVAVRCGVQTMIDVIMYQCALCLADGLLDRVELLGQIEAGAALGKHFDDAAEVTFRALQPFDDIRMTFMSVIAGHEQTISPLGGYRKVNFVASRRAASTVAAPRGR